MAPSAKKALLVVGVVVLGLSLPVANLVTGRPVGTVLTSVASSRPSTRAFPSQNRSSIATSRPACETST
jgi:hypothetical protein